MAGLADFIASGERSAYIVKTLADLENFVGQEREAIVGLEAQQREPLHLPSIDEIEHEVRQFDERLKQDPETAKEQLRRWLKDGTIRVGPRKDGAVIAEGDLLPFVVISDGGNRGNRKREQCGPTSMVPHCSTVVAGARGSHRQSLFRTTSCFVSVAPRRCGAALELET